VLLAAEFIKMLAEIDAAFEYRAGQRPGANPLRDFMQTPGRPAGIFAVGRWAQGGRNDLGLD